ncbi:MAG: C40 family peptidase, partial [Lachnospiraceae bacterium]|nr:C40 family peptidase [Lachnospiraceae bacterium]
SDGYMTKYAHLGSRYVSNGETVEHGQLIGRTGSTGSITGSHLHIECLYDGDYFNPLFYFENGEGSFYAAGSPVSPTGDVAALLNEADRYVGYPYVWGGSRPSEGFDCSGFVCYVLKNSGYADISRTNAQGIYNSCQHISPSEAQPGDIIFFTGTYNSGNPVSHVGIYCGTDKMIHAGDPIKYSSINTPYWQEHFYGFGRVLH